MMADMETMMNMSSVWHWLLLAAAAASILYPTGRILGRIGLSPFGAAMIFVPVANIAFSAWPRCKGAVA